jgi:hypothetical protein
MDALLAPTTIPSNHNSLVLIINIVVVKAELAKREGTVFMLAEAAACCPTQQTTTPHVKNHAPLLFFVDLPLTSHSSSLLLQLLTMRALVLTFFFLRTCLGHIFH